MRKIQIAISSDLCIRLAWNLTGSCGQQQRLRGWSCMVVKQFQGGGRPPFLKSIYRHIAVKNHRIFMKFGTRQQILNWMNVTWLKTKISKIQDGGRPPFWKSLYRHISAKNHIRFRWNCVHSSRFWTGWTPRDQKWKSCVGQTPSSTERVSCFNGDLYSFVTGNDVIRPLTEWIDINQI